MVRFGNRWRSIERTLPLLILCLQVGTVAAFTLAASERVERILLATAGQRLRSASMPVALLLEQSTARFKTQLSQVATDSAVLGYLATGRGVHAARQALARAWIGEDHPRGRIELRQADGTVALDTTQGAVPAGSGWLDRTIRARTIAPGTPGVGPLVTFEDATYMEAVAAVASASRPTDARSDHPEGAATPRALAYIADLRFLSTKGAATVRELIGDQATVLLGSWNNGDWTDLEHPAAGPPASAHADHPVVFDSSARGPGVGAAAAIRGTPWLVWVEQPRSVVLAPMHALVLQLATLAVVLLVIGAAGAWALGRRITRPIVALTEAAERVAATSSTATPRHEQNEIARLTDAFDRMSARVEDTHHELEARVAARTRELEAAQERLVQKERLAMLGQLASAVGHELRNPLGVMTNALYVLDHSLPDAQPTVREYIGLLRGQIAISERIVGDLLDTARVRPPQVVPVSLAEQVDTQLQRLGPLGGVEVSTRFPTDLPRAAIDQAQLAQILLNLFSNAVQAMSDSDAGMLKITGYADVPGRVCLSIADTGSGMAPDVLDRVFEPLFTTKARGLGLGLWVSQTLAHSNGAELSVTSQVGEGACFVLAMAASPSEARAA